MGNQPATNQQQNQQRALATYVQLKAMVKSEDVIGRFAEVLGTQRARVFLASVLNYVATSDGLANVDPKSILQSAMTAALLDLPIDKNLGFAWIVPYKGIAQFQMGAKGYTQLALRSNVYEVVNYATIFEGEEVKVDKITGRVSIKGEPVSDKIVGFISFFRLKNGYEHFMYWTTEQMTAHAKRYSKTYSNPNSKWHTEYEKMGHKTILSNNLRKFGVLSVVMQEAMERDDDLPLEEFFTRRDAEVEPPAGDVIDTTFTETEPEPAPFDPVEVLTSNGISENPHAAKGLLKRIPQAVAADREGLVVWGRMYRERRDAGDDVDAAALFATTMTEMGAAGGA